MVKVGAEEENGLIFKSNNVPCSPYTIMQYTVLLSLVGSKINIWMNEPNSLL